MNRRNLLIQLGSGAILCTAGCLGDPGSPNDPEAENERDGETKTPDSSFSIVSCPPYGPIHNRAVCSHTVDREAESVYLLPDREQATLSDGVPEEEMSLKLHNQSSSELTFNPHNWRIWHKTDSEWEELERQLSGDGSVSVSAGETHSWSLVEAVESIQEDAVLVSGEYAAEIRVPDPETEGEWIACVSVVQLIESN